MSHRATNEAWRTEGLKPLAKLLLVRLADFANDEGEAWPSLATLSRDTCMSKTSVCEHLRKLEDAGLVRRRQGGAPGRARSTLYRLHLFAVRTVRGADSPPNEHRGVRGADSDSPPNEHRGVRGADQNHQVNRHRSGERTVSGDGADPPPPKSDDHHRGSLPWLEARLRWLFPDAPVALTGREPVALGAVHGVLAGLSDDDWLALRVWFTEADDQVRGRKLWPRSRAEFLEHASEAIEKVRKWWRARGSRWWTARGKRVPARADNASEPTADFREFWAEHGTDGACGLAIDEARLREAWQADEWHRRFNRWLLEQVNGGEVAA